ncbi:MAG: helix-turn-helix domain-containing protein [Deltaproteobacteria bacterium]|nr:helix-turn-helix domain-containing protein [Deltaproteobacteria bacterium]
MPPFPHTLKERVTGVLTLHELAAYLRVADKTIYGLAQRGLMPEFKVGGQWRFRRSDVEAWVEAQTTRTPRTSRARTSTRRRGEP